jgi:uncharacterized protein YkwD
MKALSFVLVAFVLVAVIAARFSASDVRAAITCTPCDVNADGSVNSADVSAVATHFGQRGAIPSDVNHDGMVTSADISMVAAHFGEHRDPATSTPTASDCTADPSLDSEERAFLTLINDYRAQNGRSALAISHTLTKSSQWKSNDMGAKGYFAHDDQRRTWVARVRDCGYGGSSIGENIAAGYSTAQAVFTAWKNSPDHNANMLGSGYHAIGIGRAYVAGSPYGWYWTTDFGSVADGAGGLVP